MYLAPARLWVAEVLLPAGLLVFDTTSPVPRSHCLHMCPNSSAYNLGLTRGKTPGGGESGQPSSLTHLPRVLPLGYVFHREQERIGNSALSATPMAAGHGPSTVSDASVAETVSAQVAQQPPLRGLRGAQQLQRAVALRADALREQRA